MFPRIVAASISVAGLLGGVSCAYAMTATAAASCVASLSTARVMASLPTLMFAAISITAMTSIPLMVARAARLRCWRTV